MQIICRPQPSPSVPSLVLQAAGRHNGASAPCVCCLFGQVLTLVPSPCAAGGGRVYRCLEDHRGQEGFSDGCRDFLEDFMKRQSSDYKLNYGGLAAG